MFRLMRLNKTKIEILKGELLKDFFVTYDGRVFQKAHSKSNLLELRDVSDRFSVLRVVPNG
jgi:hypothetical protein